VPNAATVAEFGDCRRCLAVFCDRLTVAVFGDSRTFLRQCGQSLTDDVAHQVAHALQNADTQWRRHAGFGARGGARN